MIPEPQQISKDIRKKLREYYRVLLITKKPDRQEFMGVVKVTGLGIVLIGTIGLIIMTAFMLMPLK